MCKYTEGICQDGAAILCDGEMMTISEILYVLNLFEDLEQQLKYAHNSIDRHAREEMENNEKILKLRNYIRLLESMVCCKRCLDILAERTLGSGD